MKHLLRAIEVTSLLLLATLSGCAELPADETEAIESEASPLVESTGALNLGDGTVLPFRAVSTSTSTAPLGALPLGSTSPLVVSFPAAPGVDRLFPQSGKAWSLALGADVYSLGPTSLTRVAFPAVSGSTSVGETSNAFLTVSFKPTEIKYLKASFDIAKPPVGTAPLSPPTFHVVLGGAQTSATAAIDGWSVDATGRGSFTLHIAASEIAAWNAWPDAEVRSGTLSYGGSTGLLQVTLTGVTKEKPTRDDSLQTYQVKCYSEHTKLTFSKVDA